MSGIRASMWIEGGLLAATSVASGLGLYRMSLESAYRAASWKVAATTCSAKLTSLYSGVALEMVSDAETQVAACKILGLQWLERISFNSSLACIALAALIATTAGVYAASSCSREKAKVS